MREGVWALRSAALDEPDRRRRMPGRTARRGLFPQVERHWATQTHAPDEQKQAIQSPISPVPACKRARWQPERSARIRIATWQACPSSVLATVGPAESSACFY